MNKTRIPRLGMLIGTTLALLAPPAARSTEDAPTTRKATMPRYLSPEEHTALHAAIQTAQADGAERIAEIVAALRAAGYELEAAKDQPHVFRIVSPRVSGIAPTVNLFLYPVGTTLEQMRFHGKLISIGRDYNAPGAFAFSSAHHPTFERDLPPIPREQEILGAQVLQKRVFTALAEFPDIRTTAPRPEVASDTRRRELSARIKKMDTLRREVARWRAETTADQEAMTDTQRRQASSLEQLESALEETIGKYQEERLDWTSAPP